MRQPDPTSMTSGRTDAPPLPVVALDDERTAFHQVNGVRLRRREWGPAAAPPVVLLHGLRGYSGSWRPLASRLRETYRLIAIDQRGRGDSDWDPGCNYYTDAYLADLEAVVDDLRITRFALIGHSMGGTTSYVYADRHPERLTALVVEDIAPGSSTVGAGAERIVAEMDSLPERFESWSDARAYWRATRSSLSEAAIEDRLAESLREDGDGRVVWRYDAAGIKRTRVSPESARVVDLWPAVERLSVPTLIIHGSKSDFCPATTVAEMRRRNLNINSFCVEGASHYVHDDSPDAFAQCVRRFFASLGVDAANSSGERQGVLHES